MIKTEIPKDVKDLSPKKRLSTTRIFGILVGAILVIIIVLSLIRNKESDTSKLFDPLTQTPQGQAKQYNYHKPVQFTSNFPVELLVEEVANEQVATISIGTSQTIYTYDSRNTPQKVLELYRAALGATGWEVGSARSGLEAVKGQVSVDIEVEAFEHGSEVKLILKNEKI